MSEEVKEININKEIDSFKQSADRLFQSESNDGSEPPLANCLVHEAIRCINKLQNASKCKIEELSKSNEFYKSECENIWTMFKNDKQFHLEMAQRIVSTDSSAVANVILNMYFGKMPSDSVSFCEIFDLKGKGCCKEGLRCTDCIDNFLMEYYRKRIEENS